MFCKEIYPITLSEVERALSLLKEFPSINSRDAIHAATMLDNGIKRFYHLIHTPTLLKV